MSSIVSHKHKFIFCHIPRTGGTSFTEFIEPHLGKGKKDYEIEAFEKHQPLYAFKIGRTGKVFDNYRKIAIIRNPYTRFMSLVYNNPPVSVDDATDKDEYWWSMKKWLCDTDGTMLCDLVVRFEELPDCIYKLLFALGFSLKTFSYTHLNKREYVFDENKNYHPKSFVREKYEEDFELFGY